MQDHEGEAVKLLKGENLPDGVERLRRRGRELKADLHRIRSAPVPSSYAKARMKSQIEALAQAGTPDVASLIEHDGKIGFQTQQVQSTVYNAQPGAVAFAEVADAVALVAWLHRDLLIKRLDAEIDTESDDAAALSHIDREKQESEVMGDLLAVERDESALVWLAWDQRLPVEFRPDCDPRAVLGIALVIAPHVAARGTSPEHGISFAVPSRPKVRAAGAWLPLSPAVRGAGLT